MLEDAARWLNTSEVELKTQILDSVQGLTAYKPEQWPISFLDSLTMDQTPEAFVSAISDQADFIRPAKQFLDVGDPLAALRFCALLLESVLNGERGSYYTIQAAAPFLNKIYLAVVYALVYENTDSAWQFTAPPDQIMNILADWGSGRYVKTDQYWAEISALAEIERFVSLHPQGGEFEAALKQFQAKAKGYLNESIGSVMISAIVRLSIEACFKSIAEFGDFATSKSLDPNARESQDDLLEILNEMNKFEKKIFARRFELKERRGGPRNKNKSAWTDEMKIRLYEATSSLPTISEMPMWLYAYEELKEKDFDARIIDYLRSRTPLKDAPRPIFDMAVKKWRKFKDAFEEPKEDESYKAFELYHANSIVGGPESKFSTLRKYFFDGRKLAKAKENVGESKK